ncbi:MAG: antibiotic biosynthesis monooxygenase [Cyanobacteria bacterium P01_A01_bin.84]
MELTVELNKLDEFRSLTSKMLEFTSLEDGVLIYERFLSEDTGNISIYERYETSEAASYHTLI